MRMKFGAKFLHHVVHGTASDLALLDLAGTAVNDLVPLRFRIGILSGIEAGDELMGQIRPVGRGQGQHFGNLFSSDTHAIRSSAIGCTSTSVERKKILVKSRGSDNGGSRAPLPFPRHFFPFPDTTSRFSRAQPAGGDGVAPIGLSGWQIPTGWR